MLADGPWQSYSSSKLSKQHTERFGMRQKHSIDRTSKD
jgi:hypothetical protein